MENKTVSTALAILVMAVLGLWLMSALNVSVPVEVKSSAQKTDFSVIGEGKVEVKPDMASINAGVTATAPTVDEVKRKIDDASNKIVAAVKGLGIPAEDIQTSNYSTYPNQDYSAGKAGQITGYTGNVNIQVKVKNYNQNPDLLPRVVDAVTKAGANQIFGTSFTVEKPEKYREEARNLAIANAKEQAEKLAKNLGIKLGKITNVVEGYSTPYGGPVPMMARMEAGGAGGAGAAFESGTQTIYSTVTLFFEKR